MISNKLLILKMIFFNFHKKILPKKESQKFLKSNKYNIEMLNNYLRLKKIFIKYNILFQVVHQ